MQVNTVNRISTNTRKQKKGSIKTRKNSSLTPYRNSYIVLHRPTKTNKLSFGEISTSKLINLVSFHMRLRYK